MESSLIETTPPQEVPELYKPLLVQELIKLVTKSATIPISICMNVFPILKYSKQLSNFANKPPEPMDYPKQRSRSAEADDLY